MKNGIKRIIGPGLVEHLPLSLVMKEDELYREYERGAIRGKAKSILAFSAVMALLAGSLVGMFFWLGFIDVVSKEVIGPYLAHIFVRFF